MDRQDTARGQTATGGLVFDVTVLFLTPAGGVGSIHPTFAYRGFMEYRPLNQSGFAPENFTTLAHFPVSSTTSLPKSAGEPANVVPPISASRVFIMGSARLALISRLSLLTT